MTSIFSAIGTVVLSTVAIYLTAVVSIQLAGRRTVAQLSAFDVVVTIALGSVVATTAVSSSTSYPEGAAALLTLLALQVAVAWARRRFARLRRLLEFEPEVVVSAGKIDLPSSLWRSQLTEDELWSQLRQQGVFDTDAVVLAVLEPSGQLSVIRCGDAVSLAALPADPQP